MIVFNSNKRSEQKEIMDDLDFDGVQMQRLLDDLKIVNKYLGGNAITFKGIERLLGEKMSSVSKLHVVDLGCGDGEMLRQCVDYFNKKGIEIEGLGIDFNPNILEDARAKSKCYPRIHFQNMDVLLEIEALPKCDVILGTLFFHHLRDDELLKLIPKLQQKSKIGIVINDLHRSRLAFYLFKIFAAVFLKTEVAKNDGAISVARGFRKNELKAYSKKMKIGSRISWHWAFRYLWILRSSQ